MAYDLLVKSTKVVGSQSIKDAGILVKDGKIAALLSPEVDACGIDVKQVIDAKGLYAFPGMVDLHVHIGEPGKTEKEDTTTGTKAAAAGGVTTIVVMPNCVPPVNSKERVYERAELFKQKSFVDFALLGGAGGESIDQIVEQAEAGVVGYKSYIGKYRDERKGLICDGTGDIYEVLRKIEISGRFIGYHCEDSGVIRRRTAELVSKGRVDFRAYHESRPEYTEVLATLPLLEIAKETGARLYLVHISSPRTVRLADLWRQDGADVTVETCPHYLVFTDEDHARLGPYAQVAPPLRSPAAVEELWETLNEGLIDVMATDHAPGTPGEKVKGMKNVFEGGGGLPEVEVAWPLLINEVNKGRTSLETLCFLMAENPARIGRIYPQKGILEVGSDADIVLIDKDAVHRIDASRFYTKNKDSGKLFDGMEMKGRVEKVIQRGRLISERGVLTVDKPIGALWVTPR